MRHSSLGHTFCLSLVAAFLLLSLPSCSSLQSTHGEARQVSSYSSGSSRLPTDDNGGYYKIGNPYQVKGRWYHPEVDYSYDETGIASWYGQDFHNKRTANGEIFNKNELTAAHKTLPLPCLARITNLENGKSLVVRVNDRGPFSGKRIIDLSQRAAQLLGFENNGIAKVRVQVMKEESKAIADAMRSYGTYASNQQQIQPIQVAEAPDYISTNKLRTAEVEVAPIPPATQQQTIATFKPAPIVEQVEVSGDNNIYVQAGAFTNIDNARRLEGKLAPLGQTVMKSAVVNNKKFYRVRIGPIASVAMADRMIDRVINSGASNEARIVID